MYAKGNTSAKVVVGEKLLYDDECNTFSWPTGHSTVEVNLPICCIPEDTTPSFHLKYHSGWDRNWKAIRFKTVIPGVNGHISYERRV